MLWRRSLGHVVRQCCRWLLHHPHASRVLRAALHHRFGRYVAHTCLNDRKPRSPVGGARRAICR
ncbi:hypothetical protein IQ230_24735 [Gloeocapsopsis crepidinum LEGE 06123]|uniref:Uncharacterized protein n=1 Tax=Gloeocapsopsis crepidinum LEGE 06123 TaxID=588587 RepID=A0ABR9UYT9_9CHRO|nr:hypothetical protein [Gloeocapsopsis crepidinum]MBE9193485.1 hypothetical protein [Gloeocapsopsis crepidinum LEGE 06123]